MLSKNKKFTPTPECQGRKPVAEWAENPKSIIQCHGRRVVVWGFTLTLCLILLTMLGFGCKNKNTETGGNTPVPIAVESPTTTPASNTVVPAPPVNSATKIEDLKRLARDFAEVWGTYSSTTNCQNVRDLLSYMSENYRTENESFLDEDCQGTYSGPTFNWQTKALDAVILNQNETNAGVLVVCERTQKSSQGTIISYPNLIVDLLVEQNSSGINEWKIDGAEWNK